MRAAGVRREVWVIVIDMHLSFVTRPTVNRDALWDYTEQILVLVVPWLCIQVRNLICVSKPGTPHARFDDRP
jgi:hypothetical protein